MFIYIYYATVVFFFNGLIKQCGSRKRGSDMHRAISARFAKRDTAESDRADFHVHITAALIRNGLTARD